MTETTDALVLDLVEWIGREPRLYSEVIETWRTSCPRLTIWEDAVDLGYVTRTSGRPRRMRGDHRERRQIPARAWPRRVRTSHSRARGRRRLTRAGDPLKFMQSHLSCENNNATRSRIAP